MGKLAFALGGRTGIRSLPGHGDALPYRKCCCSPRHRVVHVYSHKSWIRGCYKGAIQAWAPSGRPDAGDRATSFLDRLENAQRVDRNAILPNGICYKNVMMAIGRSDDPHKARNVHAVLDRMKLAFQNGNRYALPSDDHYAAVLRACTTVNGSSEENA
jgi:hypothetical protein